MSEPRYAAGSRIQRFEVIGFVGGGAMGAVYRARDPQLQRTVAIKVLGERAEPSTLSSYETQDLRGAPTDDLLGEAQIMARLSHPNVLPVYEVGLVDGGVFVVMEYVAGCDLRTWLAQPRSTTQIAAVFAQAAQGLAAAHAQGVVHRDFKPENVLIGDDGRVRVADFGLSRLVSSVEPLLRVERVIGGTPFYMAPELWKGEAASAASDVFAFCVALHEALTTPRADPAEERPMPRRLRAVVAAGMSEDPQTRAGLGAVIEALRPPRGRRWLAAALGAAVAAALAAAWSSAGSSPCVADALGWEAALDGPRRAALATLGAVEVADAYLAAIEAARRGVCEAEASGRLTRDQARARVSCLERRAYELAATAERATVSTAASATDAQAAQDALAYLPSPATCAELRAPPRTAAPAAVKQLFARWAAAEAMAIAAPERTAALDDLAARADALGERELAARAAASLGMRQIETDQLAAADQAFARAHDLAASIQDNATQVTALGERSIAARRRGDAAAAISYAKLASELADKPDAPPGRVVYVAWVLATAEIARGELASAIARLERALEILSDERNRDRFREIEVRFALIGAYQDLGGHEAKALRLAQQNLGLARTALGERSESYGVALNVVAIALRQVGEATDALTHRRRALAVLAQRFAPDHSVVLGQRANIAADLFATGQFEAARAEAAALIAASAENERARAWRPSAMADVGVYTFATGRTAEGMRQFERGLDALVAQKGLEHPEVLEYRRQRIDLELELGRVDDAERHSDDLEESYRQRGDQARGAALLAGLGRAVIALDRGQPAEAESRARAALEAWTELRGDSDARAELLRVLAASLVARGRWAEALAAADDAAALVRSRPGLEDRLVRVELVRAQAWAGQGLRAKARATAAQCLRVLARFPGAVRARAEAAALLSGARASGTGPARDRRDR